MKHNYTIKLYDGAKLRITDVVAVTVNEMFMAFYKETGEEVLPSLMIDKNTVHFIVEDFED